MEVQSNHRPSEVIQFLIAWGVLITTSTVQASLVPQNIGRVILFVFLVFVLVYIVQSHRVLQLPRDIFFGLLVIIIIQVGLKD